MFVLPAILQHV